MALIGIRCALIRKDRTIGAKSKFATLNVGSVRHAIKECKPKIIRKVEKFDESHAGIYVQRGKAIIAAYKIVEQVRRADMHSKRGYDSSCRT